MFRAETRLLLRMSEISSPLLLKRKEAAVLLSCHPKHIEELVRQGKLLEIRLGAKTPRVTRESIERLISGK